MLMAQVKSMSMAARKCDDAFQSMMMQVSRLANVCGCKISDGGSNLPTTAVVHSIWASKGMMDDALDDDGAGEVHVGGCKEMQ